MLPAEFDELGKTRHGAVVVLNLTDDPGRLATRQSGEVDGCFGMAGTLQHAAFARTKREYVARSGESLVADGTVGECTNGECSVGGGDSGAGSIQQIHRHGECGSVALGVVVNHHW